MSSLGIVLKEITTFPSSEPTPAPTDPRLRRRARINYLGEIPDGSHRRFVPDLNGTLYVLNGDSAAVYLDVKATIGDRFFSGKGMGSGFGFVTFHPDFRKNGKFYTAHTESPDEPSSTPDFTEPTAVVHGVITEWTADDPRASTFTGRHRELLRLGFATYIHGIQQIDFNATARPGAKEYGLLYVAVGDGGIGTSTSVPQDLGVPFGKVLRIDALGTNSGNGKYGVPSVNPFVGKAGALGEIFAYGMRDPHRFSWDPGGQHRMFLGHIGERHVEAIHDLRAGDNLGWSEREGPLVFDKNEPCHLYELPDDDAKYGYAYPVAAYDHNPPPGYPCNADVGHAVSGGFVYRGKAVPALAGKYVFTDLVDGRVMYTEEREMRRSPGLRRARIHELLVFDSTGRAVPMAQIVGDKRVDLRFGRDGDGELYLLSKANGKVWKIVGTRRVPRSAAASTSSIDRQRQQEDRHAASDSYAREFEALARSLWRDRPHRQVLERCPGHATSHRLDDRIELEQLRTPESERVLVRLVDCADWIIDVRGA